MVKGDDTITDQNAFQFDAGFSLFVVLEDKLSQIWNVLACIRFTGNPESSVSVFRELVVKFEEGVVVVMSSYVIVVFEGFVHVVRIAHTSWGFEEE